MKVSVPIPATSPGSVPLRGTHRGGGERHRHAGCSLQIAHTCVAVAGDLIIAAEAFEFIDGAVGRGADTDAAGIGGCGTKTGCVKSVAEIGPGHALDRAQQVGPIRRRHGPGEEIGQ